MNWRGVRAARLGSGGRQASRGAGTAFPRTETRGGAGAVPGGRRARRGRLPRVNPRGEAGRRARPPGSPLSARFPGGHRRATALPRLLNLPQKGNFVALGRSGGGAGSRGGLLGAKPRGDFVLGAAGADYSQSVLGMGGHKACTPVGQSTPRGTPASLCPSRCLVLLSLQLKQGLHPSCRSRCLHAPAATPVIPAAGCGRNYLFPGCSNLPARPKRLPAPPPRPLARFGGLHRHYCFAFPLPPWDPPPSPPR